MRFVEMRRAPCRVGIRGQGRRAARWTGLALRAAGRAAIGLGAAAVLPLASAAMLLLAPASVLAASPEPTTVGVGDPRSSGQGPGLVGDPLSAILVVAAIAALAVALTLLYVRATDRRADGAGG